MWNLERRCKRWGEVDSLIGGAVETELRENVGLYTEDCNVYMVVIEDVLDLRQLGLVIINHTAPNAVGSVKGNELVSSDDHRSCLHHP